MSYLEVLSRGLVLFSTLYFLARVLNKKLISQMTFFDFVAGITLGSMTATLTFSVNVSLGKGVFGLILFALLVLIIDVLCLKNFHLRKVFNSEPTVLMDNGKVLENGMKKVRFTVDELLIQLRKKNVFHFSDVESAVLETDGSVSVLKKAGRQTITQQDLNIIKKTAGLPQIVMIEGNVLPYSLKSMGKDESWLKNQLKQRGISDLTDVIVAQLSATDELYIDTKKDRIDFSSDE
ncbi:DUF421 domain-containing protein [Halobacillus litoralis]|uniref:YetF C-terminal domain-containing protein n=1 Tax=Halobacillus litoralis TaxID=45668 RepID=A0A410MI22_9BACI|nr:DUF421 domain-containing protein [Halobacillus litoralis]QAS54361.1 hypothetical protein HLI_20130 [Halobacillus litoralis]